jgi:hypothetical protein
MDGREREGMAGRYSVHGVLVTIAGGEQARRRTRLGPYRPRLSKAMDWEIAEMTASSPKAKSGAEMRWRRRAARRSGPKVPANAGSS